jgi:putative transposase
MAFRQPYPTALNDTEWAILEPLIPAAKPGGRPEEYPKREIVHAILPVLRPGGAWRHVPHDVPPWGIVYHYFWRWRKDGPWKRINETLRGDLRVLAGRNRQPSAALIDSQSVNMPDRGGATGFESAKQSKGRKRPILVDTLGLLMAVVVTAARVQDRDGAKLLLGILRHWFPRLRCMWADGAYAGFLETWVALLRRHRKVRLEIVKRSDHLKGFIVLPKRWIVERTFGWFYKYRRLSKDDEYLTDTSEAMLYVAMIQIMVRRIALKTPFKHALSSGATLTRFSVVIAGSSGTPFV